MMKPKSLFISTLLVASLAMAGCGADNNTAGTDAVGATTPLATDFATAAAPDTTGDTGIAPTEAPLMEATTEAPAAAVTTEAVEEAPAAAVTTQADEEVAGADTAASATALMDYTVQNSQGEALGEIEDLMVDVTNEEIRYAVLSFGGFLDIGEKLFAIPVSALTIDHQNEVVLFDVDEKTLQDAPGFDTNNWPDTANPEWDVPYRDFWQDRSTIQADPNATEGDTTTDDSMTQGDTTTEDQMMAAGVVRASEMLGYNIENSAGDDVGEIEDIVVDLTSGRVLYAVLSFGGFADLGENFYAVPLRTLNFNHEAEAFALDVDENMLQNAPSFSMDDWPNNINPDLGEEAREYWDNELSMQ